MAESKINKPIIRDIVHRRIQDVNYSIPANGIYNANLYTMINNDLPSGYECIGVVGFRSNNANVYVSAFSYLNTNYSLELKNLSNSSVSSAYDVLYLAIKR